ncbi:MAG: YitT family protein, partial [Clostridia bacterium]
LGVIAYTLAIQFCKFNIDVGKDPLLSSIFGGIFIGIGLGMVIKGKGSTGGTEMLALLIHKNQPNIKVGSIYMFVNAIVIGLNLIFYTPVIALYSCVTIIISGKIADTVVVGLESVRAFNIVTMKPNEMAKEITKELKCGCTWVDSKGMYSGNNYDMLICVVNRQQILPLKEIISKIDKTAFVYSTSVSEAMGGNFAQIKQRKTKNNPTGKSIQNVVVTKPATVIEKIENDIESEKNEKILQQQENKKTNKIDIE